MPSAVLEIDGVRRVLRREDEQIDVTPIKQESISWRYVDRCGHLHRWQVWVDGEWWLPFEHRPMDVYGLPTLRNIEDSPAEDGRPSVSHWECKLCGEHIQPGYEPSTYRRYD